jgi:hypothetical protein
VEEYGARIVKPIKSYVVNEGLEEHLAVKRAAKPSKEDISSNVSKKIDQSTIIEIEDDDDEDPFDDGGIDWATVVP